MQSAAASRPDIRNANTGVSAAYMPQLDGLRAFAVAAVVVYHFVPGGWNFAAYLGVKLFFTLSGFLITGILLKARETAETENQNRTNVLGRFYVRRFLRIFPLYYFVVTVAWVIDLEPTRKIIVWLLTYTLNIRMAWQGYYEASFAHFWSLAVEEQFYLVAPWLVLFLPKKWIKPALIAVIAIGPLYRLSYILSGYTNMTSLSAYLSTTELPRQSRRRRVSCCACTRAWAGPAAGGLARRDHRGVMRTRARVGQDSRRTFALALLFALRSHAGAGLFDSHLVRGQRLSRRLRQNAAMEANCLRREDQLRNLCVPSVHAHSRDLSPAANRRRGFSHATLDRVVVGYRSDACCRVAFLETDGKTIE
jgi:hypothetical protein